MKKEFIKEYGSQDLVDYINQNPNQWETNVRTILKEHGLPELADTKGNLKVVTYIDGEFVVVNTRNKAMKMKDSPRLKLAWQFADERKKRNITRENISLKSGISIQNIYKFETGIYNPSLDVLNKLIKAIDMKIILVEL